MEFLIILIIVGVTVYFSVKKQKEANKQKENAQKYIPPTSVYEKEEDVFKNTSTPPLVAQKQPTIKPQVRDHLHGTTTITSRKNCKKPHDGSYVSKSEIVDLSEDRKIVLSDEEIKKMVIFADAISTPAFKRRRR